MEATKLLTAELTRCLGYFKRENTVLNRSHSSEKCDQEYDKRSARSSIVRSKKDSDTVRGDLISWVLLTPLSVFEAIGSGTGCQLRNGSMPLHSVSIVTEECALLSVSRKLDAATGTFQ